MEAGTEYRVNACTQGCEKYWNMGLIHWQTNKICYSSNATFSLCHFISPHQVNVTAFVSKQWLLNYLSTDWYIMCFHYMAMTCAQTV
jgi:hypothetical protein